MGSSLARHYDAGVVAKYINNAVFRESEIHQPLDIAFLGDIGVDESGLSALRRNEISGRLPRFRILFGDQHVGALLGESLSDAPANAGAGASSDGYLILQSQMDLQF